MKEALIVHPMVLAVLYSGQVVIHEMTMWLASCFACHSRRHGAVTPCLVVASALIHRDNPDEFLILSPFIPPEKETTFQPCGQLTVLDHWFRNRRRKAVDAFWAFAS